MLTFINHACFTVETTNAVLLIDPWVEGNAFNMGWQLLDSTLSNAQLVDWLKTRHHKEILIYFSHEHSDHFSTSFIREVVKADLKIKFLYPETADGRVKQYLASFKRPFVDLVDGVSLSINNEISITNWKFYSGGDSYLLIEVNDASILNLNDCDVQTDEHIREISNNLKEVGVAHVDVLFTQFGYANWIGNLKDRYSRSEAAESCMKRVARLNQRLKPKVLVPFASFSYFCDEENFYLNYEQVSPQSMYEYAERNKSSETIRFMKPWDVLGPLELSGFGDRANPNHTAINHWLSCISEAKPIKFSESEEASEAVLESAKAYIQTTNRRMLQVPRLLSLFRLSKPIQILVTDLNIVLECSYSSGAKWSSVSEFTISCKSNTVNYLFKYPFGFNTLSVNAKFQVGDAPGSINRFRDFFIFQELLKNGLDSRGTVPLLVTMIKMSISKMLRSRF